MSGTERYDFAVTQNVALLFEKSAILGYNSEEFVRCLLTSEIGEQLFTFGSPYQWLGYNYVMEHMENEFKEDITKPGEVYGSESMYWTGWIYFYWHRITGESPKEIYEQAKCWDIAKLYVGYHTQSEHVVIEELKRMYNS